LLPIPPKSITLECTTGSRENANSEIRETDLQTNPVIASAVQSQIAKKLLAVVRFPEHRQFVVFDLWHYKPTRPQGTRLFSVEMDVSEYLGTFMKLFARGKNEILVLNFKEENQ